MLDFKRLVRSYILKIYNEKKVKKNIKQNETNVFNINAKGIELIKYFEGFERHIYKDVAGFETIGYGHLIRGYEREKFLSGITKKQAEKLLCKDIKKFEGYVKKYVNVKLNENQFSALVSFCFNLGPNAFFSSTLRQKINRLEFFEASFEFEKWVYAGGVKFNGLLKRRLAEKKLFLTEI